MPEQLGKKVTFETAFIFDSLCILQIIITYYQILGNFSVSFQVMGTRIIFEATEKR